LQRTNIYALKTFEKAHNKRENTFATIESRYLRLIQGDSPSSFAHCYKNCKIK